MSEARRLGEWTTVQLLRFFAGTQALGRDDLSRDAHRAALSRADRLEAALALFDWADAGAQADWNSRGHTHLDDMASAARAALSSLNAPDVPSPGAPPGGSPKGGELVADPLAPSPFAAYQNARDDHMEHKDQCRRCRPDAQGNGCEVERRLYDKARDALRLAGHRRPERCARRVPDDGDCDFNDDGCPLHSSASDHAEGVDFHARAELDARIESMTAEERLALLSALRGKARSAVAGQGPKSPSESPAGAPQGEKAPR